MVKMSDYIRDCKTCFHADMCERLRKNYTQGCRDYKDKNKIIELPCKVGECIWVLDRENKPQKMILDEPDIRCHCEKEDNLCMALCGNKQSGICAYRFKNDGTDIGSKVFLSKSDAENKLKERNNG